jgi:hypothetical protein
MTDILSEIIKRLKNAETNTKEAIASGIHIQNFENYQRQLGNKEGLTQALEIIEELLTEDDEDN